MAGPIFAGRRPPASAVAWLAVAGALGSATMALAHTDLDVPLVSALGPGRAVLPAAVAFAIGAVLYALAAAGAFRVTPWAWSTAAAVNLLALIGAFPIRGVMSVLAVLLSATALAVLFSPGGRTALARRP